MATSSIFTSVRITDRESAERFISALEKASKNPPRVPTTEVKPVVMDREEILKIFAKYLENKKEAG